MLGESWVAAGVVIPIVLAVNGSRHFDDEQILLTIVLCGMAAILENVRFNFASSESAPMYTPASAPIVIATIAIAPANAMFVALVAGLCNWKALRDAVRGVEVRMWIETAGLGAMTAGITGLVCSSTIGEISSPIESLIAGLVVTALFTVVDGLTYVIWLQVESGDGCTVVDYYRHSMPLDIALTGTCVVLAIPFHEQPLVLLAVLAAFQLAVVALDVVRAEQHLVRGVEHVGRLGLGPLLGPGALEDTHRHARDRVGVGRVAGCRSEKPFLDDHVGVGLTRREPLCAGPDARCAEAQGSGEVAARGDTTCSDHRCVAGIGRFAITTEQSVDDWDRIFDVNLKGTFLMCREALPALEESTGVIVNVASLAGLVAHPYGAAYCASKGGVVMFSKTLALEYAAKGVRVNVLCPSGVMTPMLTGPDPRGDGASWMSTNGTIRDQLP